MARQLTQTASIDAYFVQWRQEGALAGRYDAEAGVLEVTSPSSDEFAHGLSVDGTVVFDADRALRVVNIDVLVPHTLWQEVDLEPLSASRYGCLCLSQRTLEIQGIHRPSLSILTDRERKHVHICFEEEPRFHGSPAERVALSDTCIAVISSGHLKSLQVCLEEQS